MLELKTPNFENVDWESAIENANELEKELLIYTARAANLLENVEKEISPQGLAWMIIWTHVFVTLDGARAAILRNSEFSLHLLDRSSMELGLIVFAILSPVIESEESKSENYQIVNKRLAAYAAWCLWKDISVHERRLEKRNIKPVWDDSVRHEIAEDPIEREKFERLFGRLEIEDPEELSKKRRAREEQIWESQNQLKEIADHPELKPWIDKLKNNSKRAKQKKEKWISSYYQLVGESETSIMARLIKMDIAYGYSLYEEKSSLLHASTFDKLFFFNEEIIFPRIKTNTEIIKPLIESIGSSCNSIIVQLAAINRYL